MLYLVLVAFAAAASALNAAPETGRALRVCADPNNLPFSNAREEGFENRIAALLAADLGAHVEYTWWAQRRGFLRHTLKAGKCDVVMGLPLGMKGVATTHPYYRSGYVFVTRADRRLDIASLDDPRLRSVRVGVQLIGEDQVNTPPAHALAARGIVRNVKGYAVVGDYSRDNPPADIVAAVARREVEVAIAWGPLAGYFAAKQRVPLALKPVPPSDGPLPMTFAIAMAVRPEDAALRAELQTALDRNRGRVDKILSDYHLPRVPAPPGPEIETKREEDAQ